MAEHTNDAIEDEVEPAVATGSAPSPQTEAADQPNLASDSDPETRPDTVEAKAAREAASIERDALADFDHKIAMEVLEKSLRSTDWGYKSKQGVDREIGHASFTQMERAFIHAASGDREAASKLYEKYAGRPPSEALLKRVDAMERIDFTRNINDLTAGLSKIEEKRGQHQLVSTKSTLEERIRRSHKDMGEFARRAADHRSRALREFGNVLEPDERKDPFTQEKGLFLFSAVKRGMRSGQEWGHSIRHHLAGRSLKKGAKEVEKERDAIATQIAGFSTAPNPEKGPATVGRNGEITQSFGGIASVVKQAMARIRQKGEAAQQVATPAPGKVMSAADVARRAGQDQGLGMGR